MAALYPMHELTSQFQLDYAYRGPRQGEEWIAPYLHPRHSFTET